MIRTLSVALAVCVLSACAGAPPLDNSRNAATLEFIPSSVPVDTFLKCGNFVSVDNLRLKEITNSLSIKPGKHTVGYMCAIILDGPPPPSVTMRFEPHQHYAFQCTGQFKAAVELR